VIQVQSPWVSVQRGNESSSADYGRLLIHSEGMPAFMLRLRLEDGVIKFDNGFNSQPQTVTRYSGKRWEQVGSDLLCGIADVFQDVGIVVTGESASRSGGTVKVSTLTPNRRAKGLFLTQDWVPIDDPDRRHRAIYSLSDLYGEVYVPSCRETVEDVMSWTMWALKGESGYRSTVFPGNRKFRERLDSQSWEIHNGDLSRLVTTRCLERALFTMTMGPAAWQLFPGSIELAHLVRLADPVVARINTELTE
jgi:hypothetical protein